MCADTELQSHQEQLCVMCQLHVFSPLQMDKEHQRTTCCNITLYYVLSNKKSRLYVMCFMCFIYVYNGLTHSPCRHKTNGLVFCEKRRISNSAQCAAVILMYSV